MSLPDNRSDGPTETLSAIMTQEEPETGSAELGFRWFCWKGCEWLQSLQVWDEGSGVPTPCQEAQNDPVGTHLLSVKFCWKGSGVFLSEEPHTPDPKC